MSKTRPMNKRRICSPWLAGLISVSLISLMSACMTSGNGDEDEPESATGWSWQSGSDSAGQAGVYGTKGTASSSNIPGARSYHRVWQDASGNIWTFGGHGFDSRDASGHLNDLWRYNPSTVEWTWMSGSDVTNVAGTYGVQGTPAPTNAPGARDSYATWLGPDGRLWLFGGFGFDSSGMTGDLNDLWRFDPTTREWTWVSGGEIRGQAGDYGTKGAASPTNSPGARYRAVFWTDSNSHFWLFGGYGKDASGATGDLNDLWEFDPATLEWTWVSGSVTRDQAGIYGTKGTADPANIPGARDGAVSWRDSTGKIWILGGEGLDGTGDLGQLSDLWTFEPTTLTWTWVAGNNSIDQLGVYGTMGTASSSNVPGGRHGACAWIDPNGKLWFFGGEGYGDSSVMGLLSDLWKFDPSSSQWTWVSGSKTVNTRGTFGPKGKRYLSNAPGGRFHAASWSGSNGDLWLFGGDGLDVDGARNYLGDVWNYRR